MQVVFRRSMVVTNCVSARSVIYKFCTKKREAGFTTSLFSFRDDFTVPLFRQRIADVQQLFDRLILGASVEQDAEPMVFIHVPRLGDARLAEVGAADDRPGFHVKQEDRAFSGQTELGTLDLHPDAKPFPVVCMPKNEGLRVVRPKLLRRCVIGLIDVMDQFIHIHSRSRFARRSGRVLWGEDGRLAAPAWGKPPAGNLNPFSR